MVGKSIWLWSQNMAEIFMSRPILTRHERNIHDTAETSVTRPKLCDTAETSWHGRNFMTRPKLPWHGRNFCDMAETSCVCMYVLNRHRGTGKTERGRKSDPGRVNWCSSNQSVYDHHVFPPLIILLSDFRRFSWISNGGKDVQAKTDRQIDPKIEVQGGI